MESAAPLTLRANGLVPLEHIADISSRLVVNKASWKMKHASVMALLGALRAAVASVDERGREIRRNFSEPFEEGMA